MAMSGGVDYFFANAAVANYITESFSQMTGGSAKAGSSPKASSSSGEGSAKGRFPISPVLLYRFIKAKYMAKKEERPIQPKDIFRL